MRLENVILPPRGPTATWDIVVDDGHVSQIRPSQQDRERHPPSLLLPALCHPHIHLDKPYILTSNHAGYSDLEPQSGTFGEALANTSRAKERYTEQDLYLRGSQLLATSYAQGVSSIRAFVELDHVTGTLPLVAVVRLKKDFAHLVHVQICAFAQDPIFSTAHGEANRSILAAALQDYSSSIDVLGTTPYVEESTGASHRNLEWAIAAALEHGLHLDFHLDYNLDGPAQTTPLAYAVVELLQKHGWERASAAGKEPKTVVLGHCTQLSVLPDAEFRALADTIRSSGLPIHFVGLPTSDLYMMGRPSSSEDGSSSSTSHSRPRGTLQVVSMIRDLGLSACLGANNMGNAFTPYGTGDPLQLASWGVGIYQAGTVDDARTLYGCVSWRAREAIGLAANNGIPWDAVEGQPWQPMLLIKNRATWELPGIAGGSHPLRVEARPRLTFKDVVWDPPEVGLRSLAL